MVLENSQGRLLFYGADYAAMKALLPFLTESCATATSVVGSRRAAAPNKLKAFMRF